MVYSEGVDAAISWFEEKGKNPWDRFFVNVADELSRSGKLEEAIGLFEFDILQTPMKHGRTVNLQTHVSRLFS